MPLDIGSQLGRYQIVAFLGSGGMGEVYKARDTKLERTVAIKLLRKTNLSGLEEARRRFEREARAIATLNHTNVCTIHDADRADGTDFLVMEFVEGETLDQRLARGALPLEAAIDIASAILNGLAEAHKHGVVHRDLKPGNVMLSRSGVKLMDFGLAKSFQSNSPNGSSETEAMDRPVTTEGSIIGTLEYMAPEQLEGQPATVRSDIFSFGAVLYEMVTGRRAFTGKTRASVIASILTSQPPELATLKPAMPASLDRLMRSCLEKDPAARWSSADDARIQLGWVREDLHHQTVSINSPTRRWLWPAVAALLAGMLLIVGFMQTRPVARPAAIRPIHFLIPPPENTSFAAEVAPAISVDGTRIAFTTTDASGGLQIWVRPLDSPAATPLHGTEGGSEPFWSPDGRWIGFYADGKLKRAAADGSSVQTIANVPGVFGATWSPQDLVLFGSAFRVGPLRSVAAGGGEPKTVAPPPDPKHIASHWPVFLPDGRHFLYYNVMTDRRKRGIVLSSIDTPGEKTHLLDSETNAVFVPENGADSGYILYGREGNLVARPFDSSNRKFTGEPALVAEHVKFQSLVRHGMFSASHNNILAFLSGSETYTGELTWFDRDGRQSGPVTPRSAYAIPKLSRDGSKIAVQKVDERSGGFDIWVIDSARGVPTRLTIDASDSIVPVFSPDGTRILYASNRDGTLDLYSAPLSGGAESLVWKDNQLKFASDWTRDGKYIVYLATELTTRMDRLYALPASGGRQPIELLKSNFQLGWAHVSPDGKYFTYTSNESGRYEVYVREFKPDDPQSARRWQISTEGGRDGSWDPEGKEVYYVDLASTLMAVDAADFGASEKLKPQPLFRIPILAGPGRLETITIGAGYAVLNRQKFLVLKSSWGEDKSPINVLINWTAALRR